MVTDVNPGAVRAVTTAFGSVEVAADTATLLSGDLDVYAPCALGDAIDAHVADTLTARIVCGAANNQLARPGLDEVLARRGVLYAPDYVVNAGGLVQVADERDARIIAVGTYAESPLRGAILGSTPHKLLHLSTRPVLVVPATA